MFQEINHHPKRIMQHAHARHYTHMHNKTVNTYTKHNTKLAYTCIRDTHNMHIAKRRSNRSTMQAIFDVNYHNTCATTKRDFFRENEELLGHGGLYEVGGRDHFLLKCTAYVRQNLLSNRLIKKAVYAAAVGPTIGGLGNNDIETVAEIGNNVPMVNGVDLSLDELNARLWLHKDHRTVTIHLVVPVALYDRFDQDCAGQRTGHSIIGATVINTMAIHDKPFDLMWGHEIPAIRQIGVKAGYLGSLCPVTTQDFPHNYAWQAADSWTAYQTISAALGDNDEGIRGISLGLTTIGEGSEKIWTGDVTCDKEHEKILEAALGGLSFDVTLEMGETVTYEILRDGPMKTARGVACARARVTTRANRVPDANDTELASAVTERRSIVVGGCMENPGHTLDPQDLAIYMDAFPEYQDGTPPSQGIVAHKTYPRSTVFTFQSTAQARAVLTSIAGDDRRIYWAKLNLPRAAEWAAVQANTPERLRRNAEQAARVRGACNSDIAKEETKRQKSTESVSSRGRIVVRHPPSPSSATHNTQTIVSIELCTLYLALARPALLTLNTQTLCARAGPPPPPPPPPPTPHTKTSTRATHSAHH